MKHNIEKASRLCEEGGDWERKNRLKVGCAFSASGTRCGNCGQESQGQSACSVSEYCCCAQSMDPSHCSMVKKQAAEQVHTKVTQWAEFYKRPAACLPNYGRGRI